MTTAKRQMILFAIGYFLSGAFLINFLYSFTYGAKIGVTPISNWVGWITVIYVIVTAIFNVIDRRRNK